MTDNPTPRRHRIARWTLGIFALATVGGFAISTFLVGVEPASRDANGWITVLTDTQSQHSVRITMTKLGTEAAGGGTDVRIIISICGDGPFVGELLIGESARLSDVAFAVDADPTTARKPDTLNGELSDTQGALTTFAGVQHLHFEVEHPNQCLEPAASDIYAGTPVFVSGRMQGEIETYGHILGLQGSRSSETWPAIGMIDGVSPRFVGAFDVPGLDGTYMRPIDLSVSIYGHPLAAVERIVESLPALGDARSLSWTVKGPLVASATYMDTSLQEGITSANAALAIAFGIGGSILATLVLEAFRANPYPARPATVVLAPDAQSDRPFRHSSKLVLALLALALVLRLVRRRQ